jgi:ferrous iron transport protein A
MTDHDDVPRTPPRTLPRTLDQLAPGERARIRRVGGTGALRRRLLDMGLTGGSLIELIRVAPMGDPLEFRVRGYSLSLRRSEAALVELD